MVIFEPARQLPSRHGVDIGPELPKEVVMAHTGQLVSFVPGIGPEGF